MPFHSDSALVQWHSCRTTTQSAVTGTQYQFYVVATNTYNNMATSSNSDAIGFVSAPVFAGTPMVAKNANKSFTITWTANNLGSTVTYVVKDAQSGATICTTTGTTCTTRANSAVAGVTYTFNVVATNADGNRSTSANASGHFAVVKPKAPLTVSIAFKQSSAALTASAKATLKALAAQLSMGNHVVVTGHSSAGTSYSVARATAVANYLKSLKAGLVVRLVNGGASSAQMPSATVVVTW